MNIVIVGAGEVGSHLAYILSEEGHDVTLIEKNELVIPSLDESLNVKVILDNGASASVLQKARISDADYFLAMTTSDSVNIISSSIAKSLGAKYTIARIHHKTYSDHTFFNYQLHFGIDLLINPEALCSIELAKTIRNPDRVAVECFARGEIEVQQVNVSPKSKYLHASLKNLGLDHSVRIGYINRGDTFEIPSADTRLEEGDLVTIVGPAEALLKVQNDFEPDFSSKDTKKICLFGGTETAVVLARLLSSSKRFRIKILEKKPELCEALSRDLPNVTIINGDATSLRLLEEEHVGGSDCFIACTKDDEDNIMTCIQAKSLGAKRVQSVINKSDYEYILEKLQSRLEIERAVSPRNATVREILRYLSSGRCTELASLPGNNAKIVELKVSTSSKYAEHTIKNIPWPPQTIVLALQHKFRAKVPAPDDAILAGDKLVIITVKEHEDKLSQMLSE